MVVHGFLNVILSFQIWKYKAKLIIGDYNQTIRLLFFLICFTLQSIVYMHLFAKLMLRNITCLPITYPSPCNVPPNLCADMCQKQYISTTQLLRVLRGSRQVWHSKKTCRDRERIHMLRDLWKFAKDTNICIYILDSTNLR